MGFAFRTDHRPEPGAVEALAPGIRAVTAANAGPMTFTGTRSYIVGEGEVAVIDPGPADPAHLAALRRALRGERVRAVLVTHTHLDHSPAAPLLARETGAELLGFGPHGAGMSEAMRRLAAAGGLGGGEGADLAFRPDRPLGEGGAVAGPGWRLVALHTPGHLPNHLAFALEGTGALFTGDHAMGWATTLVSPPEGDLAAFMASLRRLRARDDRVFYPGHGAPVAEPQALLAHVLAHREARSAQILEALGAGEAGIPALVARIYRDTDPRLHGAAARNVLAHLIELEARGLVEAPGGLAAGARFRRAPGA